MTADLPARLQTIRAELEAATPGPWAWGGTDHVRWFLTGADQAGVLQCAALMYPDHADAAFIASAPTTVAKLLGAVEAALAIHESIDALMNPGRHERVVKVCTGCGTDDGNWQRWPCPTITAVVAALGGGE